MSTLNKQLARLDSLATDAAVAEGQLSVLRVISAEIRIALDQQPLPVLQQLLDVTTRQQTDAQARLDQALAQRDQVNQEIAALTTGK
jgi:hypothetical protein